MQVHLYLSLIPESLVASHLAPEDFGNYLAVGTRKRSRGQAIFFEVDATKVSASDFPVDRLDELCKPHENGAPKRSKYLSIYRVLERVPTAALMKLYLVTDDGRVLGLEPKPFVSDASQKLHLYQEFAPVTPRVASTLDPAAFARTISDPKHLVSVPRIAFCDLVLGELASNPDSQSIDEIPYANIGHLRDCLRELKAGYEKQTKTVLRQLSSEVLFRTVATGFFVGDADGLVSFPMPPREALEREYYEWWRSALTTFGQ